ncbi:MAG: dipicolinate synthase subunit B [Christensenellaceae bacterium]|jgi:dipicolinate synthase subunit B|nr:dipicolinate synthase subunit B [Christensenellaceae bacterium]
MEFFVKDESKRVEELKERYKNDKRGIFYFEPRTIANGVAFGYPNDFKYVSLSNDEIFVEKNNYLTALALKQIIGVTKKKIYVCGYGKLGKQIEKVFKDYDIEFGKKIPQNADIVVNTVPAPIFKPIKGMEIIDLASAPYGFNWKKLNKENYNYRIEPALPSRFFPKESAEIVSEAIERYMRPSLVLCITGSACSYLRLPAILKELVKSFEIYPVLSENANVVNRFCDIEKFKAEIAEITGHNIITNIAGAETLSAKKELRCSLIFPATGNTIAKLNNAITDTAVLMAAKALLRNGKPCIIGISTNDALSANAKNIGELLNRKNIYFVPYKQDDPVNKPFSCICDFDRIKETIDAALDNRQIQPFILCQ